MAISVKLLRTGTNTTQNTFVVTAATGDSGKLQIQYNDSDIYNNLSGSTSDILSGASNTTITIPLNSNDNIQKGKYYFNFVADVGSSDTHTINFQIDARNPLLASEADVYAPSFRVDDNTPYTVNNGTVSAASRSLTLQYPAGSNQANISTSAANTTTALYITTSNVWTGAMQTTLSYDVTYTIAATTGYDTFTYQESGIGYDSETIDPDNALCDVYDCIENLRQQVVDAATLQRSNYAQLLSNYTYTCSLALQFREAVTCSKTAALDDIIAKIKALTNCQGTSAQDPSAPSRRVYGIGGTSESIQDIVGEMFTSVTNYGVSGTYDDNLGKISLEGNALFLNVYNDTGSILNKGKAVYVTGYDSTTGLPEVSLADNTSAVSAKTIGLVYADIAIAASGKALVYGLFEEVNTLSYFAGNRLYLSTSGNLTNTNPAPNSESQFVGTVLKAATAGQLLVSPQESYNFNSLVSGTTIVSEMQLNFQRLVVSLNPGEIQSLNTTSIQLVEYGSEKIFHIHSAQVYITAPPTSGTQIVDFSILSDTASGNAYNAANSIWRTGGISSSTAVGYGNKGNYAMSPITPNTVSAATLLNNGLYLSNADSVGTYSDWSPAEAKVIIYYSSYPSSIS
jgi:hypothetical protein